MGLDLRHGTSLEILEGELRLNVVAAVGRVSDEAGLGHVDTIILCVLEVVHDVARLITDSCLELFQGGLSGASSFQHNGCVVDLSNDPTESFGSDLTEGFYNLLCDISVLDHPSFSFLELLFIIEGVDFCAQEYPRCPFIITELRKTFCDK